MTDIFAEVDDAFRQERMVKLWKDYGKYFIAFIVSVIVFTAAIAAYKSWDDATSKKQSETVLAAIESPDFPENISVDKKGLRPAIKALLFFQTAQRHYENGDIETTKTYYQAVIDSKARHYSDMARLALAALSPETSPQATLAPILKNKKNIWRPEALIQLALYQANIEKDYTAALSSIKEVELAQNALPSLKQKADALKHLYTAELSKQLPDDAE